jgi:hypothetical protein
MIVFGGAGKLVRDGDSLWEIARTDRGSWPHEGFLRISGEGVELRALARSQRYVVECIRQE